MDTIIWIIGLGLLIAALIFMLGWMAGWEDHKKLMKIMHGEERNNDE